MSEAAEPTSPDRCPISFDQHTREHAATWPQVFQVMREKCPRVRSDQHGGFWVASKYNDVVRIAQSKDSISSLKEFNPETNEVKGGIAIPSFACAAAKPSETDPPEWDSLRGFLNRRFAPKAAEARRAHAQQLAAALVDRFIEKGEFDIVEDLTNPLPALVTMSLFGFPLDEWKVFADAVHKQVYLPQDDPEFLEALRGVEYFLQRVEEEVTLRRKEPRDDLLGYFAAGVIDGAPIGMELIKNMALNILLGGVDTTTALTSNTLLYLARHPAQRQRLIDEPELMPRACEEFLRYVTPLHGNARTAREAFTVDNWHFEEGDRILLAYASANRDPEIFEDPEQVILDRTPNRHIAFGAGMHRCLGSFLARMMFQTIVGEVLTRLPDYKIDEDRIRSYPSIGYVNGWITIPATFTPGAKVGAVIE
ncbi:MAG: cytochrome [Bradyrhizobium sp.]|nr:cytochrome [Bradyrhizobium sp.]